MIVDMEIISKPEDIHDLTDIVFAIPAYHEGLPPNVEKMFWDGLSHEMTPPPALKAGAVIRRFHGKKTYHGLVCYSPEDFREVEEAVKTCLEEFTPASAPLGFVMNGMSIPAPIRFRIMQELSRSSLRIAMFDWPHT